jgi:hypothetical protein
VKFVTFPTTVAKENLNLAGAVLLTIVCAIFCYFEILLGQFPTFLGVELLNNPF